MSYFNFFKAHDQFMPTHFRFGGPRGWYMPHSRRGNVSITENINIQNGPSGFWGFMSGLMQGLGGYGMGCGGMGMGSIFGCPSMGGMPMMGMPMMGYGMSPYAMLNGAATPQGKSANNSENNNLTQLRNLFKAKNITIEETKPGKYTATDEKGNIIGTNLSFDEISAKLSELNTSKSTKSKENNNLGENDNKANEVKNNKVDAAPDNKAKSEELKDKVSITVMDEVWDEANPDKDGHVTGETKLSGKKNAEGFDEMITVGGKRYQLQSDKVNGDPVYKSLDGDGDTYRLSKKDDQLVLIQTAADKGKLSGVGTTDIHPKRR